jgi:hypothetical protein
LLIIACIALAENRACTSGAVPTMRKAAVLSLAGLITTVSLTEWFMVLSKGFSRCCSGHRDAAYCSVPIAADN